PLYALAQETAGHGLTAYEVMAGIVLDLVLKHTPGTRDPFATRHPWYVLIETSGLKSDGAAERILMEVLTLAGERGLLIDAALASSLAQARDFWRLRESYSPAQKPEGGNIKNDISVAVARIPDFIARADAAVERLCPGARPVPLAHFGDGSVHYNIAQPPRHGKARIPGKVGRYHARGARDRARPRRFHLGRTRHRPDEACRSRAQQERGGARLDASHQVRARPERHPQSRQGAVRILLTRI
ncbi:MAG: hypothetical protein J2P51_11870, partial [Hyphomicrobiaceae bacterium]|nr:hypothetical protein [Hyphomicrobiaceae bacterium]